MTDFFAHLEEPLKTRSDENPHAAIRREAEVPRFPCQSCAGTGRWQRGRVNNAGEGKCFACGGKGYFKTSAFDRSKNRMQAAQRKATKINSAQMDFEAAYPGLIEKARLIIGWHNFARELIAQFDAKGTLSERQAEALKGSLDKVAAREAEKNKAKAANSGEVDVSAIHALFNKAQGSGLKRPKFRSANLDLSLAPAHGRNAGAIYVIDKADNYLGKVMGGRFIATAAARPETLAELARVAADPKGVAVSYGRLTGACGCCGRTLTDPASVALGIGPICAENWGL